MALPNFVPKLEVKIEAYDNCEPQEYIKADLLLVKQENLTDSFLSTTLQTPIYSLVPTIKVEPKSESLPEVVNESDFVDRESSCENVYSETSMVKAERDFRETLIFGEVGSTLSVLKEYLVPPVCDSSIPDFLACSKVSNGTNERKTVSPAAASKHGNIKGIESRPVSAHRPNKSTYEETEKRSFQSEPILSKSSARSQSNTFPSVESLIEDIIISALRGDGSTEMISGSCDAPIVPASDSPTYNFFGFCGSGQQHAVWSTEAESSMSRKFSSSSSEPFNKKCCVASSNITKPMTEPAKAPVSVLALLKEKLQAKQTSKPIRTSFNIPNHCVEEQLGTRSSPWLQERQICMPRDSPDSLNRTEAKQLFRQQVTGQSFSPLSGSSSILNINNECNPFCSRCDLYVTENRLKHSDQVLRTTEHNLSISTCSVDSLILNTIMGSLNSDDKTNSIATCGRTASKVYSSNFPNISDPVAMEYSSLREMNGLQFTDRIPELVRDSVIILNPTRVDHSTANLEPKLEPTGKTSVSPKEAAENRFAEPTAISEYVQNPIFSSKNGHGDTSEVFCTDFTIPISPSHAFSNTEDVIVTQNTKTSDLNLCFGEGVSEFGKESSQMTTKRTFEPKADHPKGSGILSTQQHSDCSNPSLYTHEILHSAENFRYPHVLGDTAELYDPGKFDSQSSKEMSRINPVIETIDISEDTTEATGEETLSMFSGVPKPIVLSKEVLSKKSEASVALNQCEREKNKSSTGGKVGTGKGECARLEILSVLNKFSEGSLSKKERAKVTVVKVKLSSSPQSVKQTSLSDEIHFIRNKGWACNRCGRLYISRRDLRNHKARKHYLLDKFVCPQCQAIFNSRVSWSSHYERCRKPVYKCPKCRRFFPSVLLYERHYLNHHESTYICIDCSPPKDFKTKGHLISHMSRIHVDVYIPCKACGKVLRTSHMAKHLRMHDRKKLQCLHCRQHFTALATLRAHWKTHSNKGKAAFMCKFCGKFFKLKPDLVRHLKEHESERSFVCKHCGKGFFTGHHLTYHLRIHGEKKFLCANCDAGFPYKHQITEHLSRGACSINAVTFSKKVKKAKE